MPLKTLSGSDAIKNARASAFSRWPNRSDKTNRIEPLASPYFPTSFRFQDGCKVFTIGSCFARNIEASLENYGFDVLTRRFWHDGRVGAASDNWMLNNYSVPSIYNEIAWAFGELDYNTSLNITEIRTGSFADTHLSVRIPLDTFDQVLARRNRIFEVTRSLSSADVFIMTLGLAEVWKDKASGLYLNTRPRNATLITTPDRFELHVLSYEEVKDYLSRALEIIFRLAKVSLHGILTVSPVPMSATFTGLDVVVSNQYSKAVLRAAAEAMIGKYERLDYFPSFESIVNSDRLTAWEDDLIHVRPEVVEANVCRLIKAYTGNDTLITAAAQPPAETSNRLEQSIFKQAKQQIKIRDYDGALASARLLHDTPLHARGLGIEASVHIRQKRFDLAEEKARLALTMRYNDGGLHGVLGQALLGQGRTDEAAVSLHAALSYSPQNPEWGALFAETLITKGNFSEAEDAISSSIKCNPSNQKLALLAERISQVRRPSVTDGTKRNASREGMRFVLLAAPRTGSIMVAERLSAIQGVLCARPLLTRRGWPTPDCPLPSDEEAFRDIDVKWAEAETRFRKPVEFLDIFFRNHHQLGAAGFKHHVTFDKLAITSEILDYPKLARVVLRRENLLAAYSSQLLVEATGEGLVVAGTQPQPGRVKFCSTAFDLFCRRRINAYERWKKKISVGPSILIDYTDACNDTGVRRICDFLNVSFELTEWPTMKRHSSNIVARFFNPDEVADHLRTIGRPDWVSELGS